MKIRLPICFLQLTLLIIGCYNFSLSQTHFTRLGNADVRSFDEGWLFSRYGLQADGSRREEPQNVIEQPGYNDKNWQRIDLPHDWAITGPFRIELAGETGKLPWKGIGWYRKHFVVPVADQNKRIFVDFDGAMAYAQLWLNGKFIGTWPYGYASFRMDLTPYLQFGKENILAVRLDTENWDSRWYPGAGIYRHVWLVKTNAVHVDHWGTYVTTPKINPQSATVNIAVTVSNQSNKPVKTILRTRIFQAGIGNTLKRQVATTKDAVVNIKAGENSIVQTNATIANPKCWDIENPNRYFAQTQILINGKIADTYYSTFGVRSLKFTAYNGFLLNGKRVDIKGTCNHHDLGSLGTAINASALRRQLQLLKDMGCNALRTSHNPPAPELLELADEMGFLVWDEAFDTWEKGKKKNDYNKLFKDWHEKDLVAMIHRDRNHPSVFIWSIGNEVMDQRNVALTKHLADIVKREDSTRPVSNGYNDPDGGREVGAAMALDVMGVNYFFGQQPSWDKDSRYANMPTIGSETSSCVSSRGEYFFGKEYQNWQVTSYDVAKPGWGCSPDEQFRTNARLPNLLGEFVWTGFDYLGEPTPYGSDETNLLNFRTDPSKQQELKEKLEEMRKNNPPSRSSYFGIIDLAGFPKDRYYLYQAHWRPNFPMAHILPHWNWKERIDSIVPVNVYTSGNEAELFLNGKSLGRRSKKEGRDFRLVWDSVVYTPGELKVIAYKNCKQWATDVVKTTGEAAKLTLTCNRKEISNDGRDLAFITVFVQDKEGLTVPRSNPLLQFEIEGPGEIIATDNGDATSFESFQSKQKHAFNGMALIVVKANKGMSGNIIVTANAKLLNSGQVVIPVRSGEKEE
ncbi:glycoside hydrolase family 2 protein [Ginsengibacter hankyongi]|uniref:Glycoside hydrolase family 2 protein n=1 Tax=Ginsengibacter hankyongi TaxID=2607284 RepID=A0A5J5IEB8_9BACT|nr:beta-galactosidase GalB [Ginsengibacter hankyongi]KAA9037758.1 glycoside hydrolase family 2 protein [Ginsengibacter hankyongi]